MAKERPLSPHLQIYKPQITMALSIMHRGTGIFLGLSAPVLIYWLYSISSGAEIYTGFQHCLSSLLGRLFMFGWTFSLFYHLCNGIRHLFWDIGKGYEIKSLYTSGRIVVICSVLLTLATWFVAYKKLGGL